MAKDPTIAEAIAIIKASATIKTHASGVMIIAKIEDFFNKDQIVFDSKLSGTRYAESFENSLWRRIRLNEAWDGHPSSAAAAIAHEAAHLISTTKDDVEEELYCRTFDALFVAELIGGFSYPDPANMTATANMTAVKTAKITAGSPLWASYQVLLNAANTDRLIDTILAIPIYSALLQAEWVVKHIDNWGGLGNRWATSLGGFVRAMVCADQRPAFFAPYILKVLHAIPAPFWTQAKAAMGEFNRIAAMMNYIEKVSVPANGLTITALEKKFNDKLRLF